MRLIKSSYVLLNAINVILKIGMKFHPTVQYEGKKKDGTILGLTDNYNCIILLFFAVIINTYTLYFD